MPGQMYAHFTRKHRCHKKKRRHRHRRDKHRARRARHHRSFARLTRLCSVYGLDPPNNGFQHRGQTRDETLSQSPTMEFLTNFENCRISNLGNGCYEPINRIRVESWTYHLGKRIRDDSDKREGDQETNLFSPPPSNPCSTDEDEPVDFDVLILGPEIIDLTDVKLMSFCGMI